MPKKRLSTQKKSRAVVEREVHHKPFDFTYDITWRIFRVMSEFTEGIEFISQLKRPVTFFGSARFKSNHRYYQDAVQLARQLGKKGFTVVTGGGPGIMEAGNKGAFEAKAESVGLNIQLPREQRTNQYVTRAIGFYYFFSRKTMLTTSAQAYVFFPGGYGTLDELFSLLTLIETEKIEPRPVILYGREYWRKLNYFIKENMLKHHQMISESDLKIYTIVDTVKEAERLVLSSKQRRYTFM